MSQNKIISVFVESISPYDLDISLIDLKDRIQQLIDQHGSTAYLDWDSNFYYAYDSNPSPRFNVMIKRRETDAEVDKRDMEHRKHVEAIKERDRVEYERLKKQFKEI